MSPAPFGVAALLVRSAAELARMLPWLAPLAALAVAAPEVLDRVFRRAHVAEPWATVLGLAAWIAVLALELTAATSRAVSRARGERPRLGETFGTAARRLVPAAGAALIATAAVLAGIAVLVAPGLVALSWLAVAPAAAVGEAGGPWRAVVRSLDLTRGHRGRVFAAAALLIVLSVAAVAASWAAVEGRVPGSVEALAQAFALTLFASLPPIGTGLVYAALREAKEAPKAAELARVFG